MSKLSLDGLIYNDGGMKVGLTLVSIGLEDTRTPVGGFKKFIQHRESNSQHMLQVKVHGENDNIKGN